MNSDAVKAKLLADERSKVNRYPGSSNNDDNNINSNGVSNKYPATNGKDGYDLENGNGSTNNNNNNNYNADMNVRTSLLLQHQDETLDVLGVAVTRVGHIAETIHDEIGQQNKILSEMEEDLSNVEEELGLVMGKLAKLLKTKDSWQLGTIVCLIGTVIILFFLVLYT